MKEKMYSVIQQIFLQYVDGVNKDGVFATIDGQQYNIKIVAKKTPVLFNGQVAAIPTIQNAPSVDVPTLTQEDLTQIENLFVGLIDYV